MEKIYLLINKSVIDNGNPHIMVTPFKSFDDAKNKLIDDVKGQEYIESGSDLYKEQIFDTFNIPAPPIPPQHLSTGSILFTLGGPCPYMSCRDQPSPWIGRHRKGAATQPTSSSIKSHPAMVSFANQPCADPTT